VRGIDKVETHSFLRFAYPVDSRAGLLPGTLACSYMSVCRGCRSDRPGEEILEDSWGGEVFQTRSSSVPADHSGLQTTRLDLYSRPDTVPI
jgi:hypothetical protein